MLIPKNAADHHWNPTKRVICYLRGTITHGIRLTKSDYIDITCFTNAN